MSDPNELQTPAINTDAELSQEVDRIIHEPSRLKIMSALNRVGQVEFQLLETVTKLQRSNLSMQLAKLEQAGYISIHKFIRGKYAAAAYSMTPAGRIAFARYIEAWRALTQSAAEEITKQGQKNQADDPAKLQSTQPAPGVS